MSKEMQEVLVEKDFLESQCASLKFSIWELKRKLDRCRASIEGARLSSQDEKVRSVLELLLKRFDEEIA